MGIETERRFAIPLAVAKEKTNGLVPLPISQFYLSSHGAPQTRIRLAGKNAFITIKGPKENGSGTEYEYPLPYRDAVEIASMPGPRNRSIVKNRYFIGHGRQTIELDIFLHDGKEKFAIAEIEIHDIDEVIEIPDWFGPEITHAARYSNYQMAILPPADYEIDAIFK